jgi:SAM-dependent methyltransferase
MYEWDLGGGRRTTPIGPELQSIHETRAQIMEPLVRRALAAGGPEATALDLACCEGWFGHRLLDWGAHRVVGIDVRPENIERAEAVRDHLGVSAERLSFRVADVFDLGELGRFDVVLCLGLIYHLENPIGALRIAHSLTSGVCVVESQLHEHNEPIAHGWGVSGEYMHQPASWVTYREEPHLQESHPIASSGGVISLIPNRVALLEAIAAAGFTETQVPPVPDDANQQYRDGHRLVVAAML